MHTAFLSVLRVVAWDVSSVVDFLIDGVRFLEVFVGWLRCVCEGVEGFKMVCEEVDDGDGHGDDEVDDESDGDGDAENGTDHTLETPEPPEKTIDKFASFLHRLENVVGALNDRNLFPYPADALLRRMRLCIHALEGKI